MTTQESIPNTGRVMREHSQEFKLTAVKRVLAGESAHVVARDLTVAVSLLSKWLKDYREQGLEVLQPRSSRPHHQPKKTSQWIIDKVLSLKKTKPELGIAAASEHLARFESVDLSPNTVGKIFKKHNLPDGSVLPHCETG
jgi:transposase-like protein